MNSAPVPIGHHTVIGRQRGKRLPDTLPHVLAQSLRAFFPSLTRVIIRYQGDSFEQFRQNHSEIERTITSERALVKKLIPEVEVLSVRAVGEEVNAG